MAWKRCCRCGVIKPLTDFRRLKSAKDGTAACGECVRAAARGRERADKPAKGIKRHESVDPASPEKEQRIALYADCIAKGEPIRWWPRAMEKDW